MQATVVERAGDPDVLELQEVPDPDPGPSDLLVEVAAAGINFIDTYHRSGLYPMDLPLRPGLEGAGTVAAVGTDITGFSVGDRVAWASAPGSYAEMTLVPERSAVPVPAGVDLDAAAAVMLQGMTAHYLVHDTYPLGSGDACLIHAAAGGVGRLLVQLAKRLGATVYATAGGEEKGSLARAAGADHVIDYRQRDFVEAIEEIAGSRPLDVVYDGVGAATFDGGIALLRRRGTMVPFGNASGPVPPVDPLTLSRNGSLYLTRPSLFDHVAERTDLERRSADLFDLIAAGALDVMIGSRFPLADAAGAHRALEGRATTGKVLLVP